MLKLILNIIIRFALCLVLILLVRFLFGQKFTIQLRDLVLCALFTAVFFIQSHYSERRQKKLDKLAEEKRENQSW